MRAKSRSRNPTRDTMPPECSTRSPIFASEMIAMSYFVEKFVDSTLYDAAYGRRLDSRERCLCLPLIFTVAYVIGGFVDRIKSGLGDRGKGRHEHKNEKGTGGRMRGIRGEDPFWFIGWICVDNKERREPHGKRLIVIIIIITITIIKINNKCFQLLILRRI